MAGEAALRGDAGGAAAVNQSRSAPKRLRGDEALQDAPLGILGLQEQDVVETEADRKRRKIEKEQKAKAIWLEKAKAKKEEQKAAKQDAIARGEAVEATPSGPPLEETPLIAAQVLSLASSALNPMVSDEHLDYQFLQLKALRAQVVSVSEAIAQRNDVPPRERKKALHRVLVDRIRASNVGGTLVSSLGGDPAVTALRKGVASSVIKFLQSYPATFEVFEGPNKKGTLVQFVRLVAPNEQQEAREFVLQTVVNMLQARGGAASVTDICSDANVKAAAKGIVAKMPKFLAEQEDFLEVAEDWCVLRWLGA